MGNKITKKTREEIVLDRIEYNIIGMFRNNKINSKIADIREMYKIPDDLYEKNKFSFDETTSLDDLIDKLFGIWSDSIPEEGPVILEICKNISILYIEYDVNKEEYEKAGLSYPTRKNYALDNLRNFIKGQSIVYFLMNRNSDVWKKVISAMVLTIPENVILKNRMSILSDYLPKISDDLIIRANEMTIIEDFELIKQEFDKKREAYKNKYGWKANIDKNKLYLRNKRAYELRIIDKLSYKNTRIKLEEDFKLPKSCDDSYINKMVNSHILYADDINNPD
jgi:hypothetical protein